MCSPPLASHTDIKEGVAAAQAIAIFRNVIDIAAYIAHHRRDHLVPTFPHFTHILSTFVTILRSFKASAIKSDKAQARIAATFPNWIAHANEPRMDPSHAKALSRLLVNLCSRTSTPYRKSKKGETSEKHSSVVSLSGPLSKHGPFMLVSYLRAASDPIMPLHLEIRKHLKVGMMEVLGSMGKFEREALMKGFMGNNMEAERVLLRSLWKEQDRIRYKGD